VVDQCQKGFVAPDFGRKPAVAHRLARLPLQAFGLGVNSLQNIIEAAKIILGSLEAQLGLVAAGVEPGNACGLLKNAAPSTGFAAIISPIWPCRTMAGERAPVEASAKSS
jgi:hypothetical protein